MKTIPLTQGKVALVDDSDFDRLDKHKWQALKVVRGHTTFWYARRMTSLKDGPRHAIYMHREVLDAPNGLIPDHIDFNGLNNQRSNLRLVTRAQNCQWRHGQKKTSSQYKGVCKSCGKWQASIKWKGKSCTIGSFEDELDAAAAYDAAAQFLFRQHAYLNNV